MSYVLFPVSEARTSKEARQHVMDELSKDPTFVNESGRFTLPICDWFVIGGRYSGQLYPKSILDNFWKCTDKLSAYNNSQSSYTDSFIQQHRKHLNSIWREMGGKYASPLTRNRGRDLGERDDACILEDWLAKELNIYLCAAGKDDIEDCYIRHNFDWGWTAKVISLDYELLYDLKDFTSIVGKYWVVVIDYHN